VFDTIVGRIEGEGRLGQTLTVLHGGGGTGKSTLIRWISSALREHGIETVSTCPTGVGASHLISGRTIHSAFKILRKTELSANDVELMRLTFTDRVWLIVVDEVSMLSAENLALIDSRSRAIYRNNLKFGGRSVILVRITLHIFGFFPLTK
jgi:thymidylate kinase